EHTSLKLTCRYFYLLLGNQNTPMYIDAGRRAREREAAHSAVHRRLDQAADSPIEARAGILMPTLAQLPLLPACYRSEVTMRALNLIWTLPAANQLPALRLVNINYLPAWNERNAVFMQVISAFGEGKLAHTGPATVRVVAQWIYLLAPAEWEPMFAHFDAM